jgi:hypothetical protein
MTTPDAIVARGWATVELGRAAIERLGDLALGERFRAAERSAVLGATCLRGRSADGRGWIVLLEPDTEGPLSAYLARHGEGWAATWHATMGGARIRPGPCGPEALEPGGPRYGPFRLRAAAATIGR